MRYVILNFILYDICTGIFPFVCPPFNMSPDCTNCLFLPGVLLLHIRMSRMSLQKSSICVKFIFDFSYFSQRFFFSFYVLRSSKTDNFYLFQATYSSQSECSLHTTLSDLTSVCHLSHLSIPLSSFLSPPYQSKQPSSNPAMLHYNGKERNG